METGRRIEKKVWPEFFQKIISGEKTFELRLADFECRPGDILVLREWDPKKKEFTGRYVEKEISYVLKTKGLDFWDQKEVETYGYQILGFKSNEITELQRKVKDFQEKYSLESPPEYRILDLLCEIGEIAKAVLKSSNYGRERTDFSNVRAEVEEELGDVFYSLITVANFFEVDLGKALEKRSKNTKNG